MSATGSRVVLAGCGAAITASLAAIVALGDPRLQIGPFLAAHGLALAAYLVALHVAPGVGRRGLHAALGLALAWRLVLALAPPLLSDDVFRSVWEGRVQGHGGNPYTWTDRPDAARWTGLRDHVWRQVNHREYPAIYPPLWQLAARGAVAVHDGPTAIKLLLVGCEVLSLLLLARALDRAGKPRSRLLIWAWSPLALVEIAGSGHNDAFAMLGLSVALATTSGAVAALALTAGALGKFLPALVGLAWARRFRPVHLVAPAALVLLAVAPYASAGPWLLHSLGKYGRYWRFNETGFAALHAMTGDHVAAVRLGMLAIVVVALVLAWRRVDEASSTLVIVATWLLLAPSVLPWYALWLLPPLVLRDAPAALLFTGTVPLAYLVYPGWLSGERWEIGWDVRALEVLPCLVVAVLSTRRRE